MFKQSLKIIDTYIEKFCDGTLQTTEHLSDSDRERLLPLCSRNKTGFLQVKNADLKSKTMDDYKSVVFDEGRWDSFVKAKLDAYFCESVDLTPMGVRDAEPDDTVEAIDQHMTPETLIRLSLGRIEKQFPGGEGPDSDVNSFGDQDLRDLISAKGLILHDNYKHLNRARRDNVARLYRFVTIVCAVCVVWTLVAAFLPAYGVIGIWPTLGIWITALPVALVTGLSVVAFHLMGILTRRRHRMLNDHFNATTRLSSATVSKCAILRQDTMIFACHHMFEIANTGKEDYWAQGRLRRWTEVNEKWCELIFWLNGRVTANANYAFIRTKLVGMSLEGLRAEAQFESLKLTGTYLALMAVISLVQIGVLAMGAGHGELSWAAAAELPFGLYMTWHILRLHALIRAEDMPEAVEEILNTDSLRQMKGHKEAKLHEEVAHFMKREKLKQLYAERTRLNSGVLNDVVGAETEPLPHDA